MKRLLAFAAVLMIAVPSAGSPALEEAIRACDAEAAVDALQNSSAEGSARHLFDSARVDLLRGETTSAVDKLQGAVERSPQSSDYRLWYSRALFARAGESSRIRQPFIARKAIAELERAIELDPENDDAAIDLLLIHLRVPILGGGRDDAESVARDLARRESDQAVFARGILDYDREDWASAEKKFRRAARTLEDPRRALFWLGYVCQQTGQWNEAIETHERLLELSPNDPRVWYEFARTADFSGQFRSRGVDLLRRYLSSDLPSGARSKQDARELLERLLTR